MASQDSKQPKSQSVELDPHTNEPVLQDWLLYGFPDFHLPGSEFLAQVFYPGFFGSEDGSDPGSPLQSSSKLSDDLGEELLGQPAIEPSDDPGHELPGQPTTESYDNLGNEPPGESLAEPSGDLALGQPTTKSSDDLGDDLLGKPLAETYDDLADELLVQPTTEPFIQAIPSFSSCSVLLEETAEDWVRTLMNMISQMMFVSGETSEASVETTTIIEEIVHTQVTEIVSFTSPPRSGEFHVLIIVHIAPTLNSTC